MIVERVGSPSAPRVAWFLHGILGRGRNWRSFARKVSDTWPSFRAVLPDLRGHGDAPPALPPHDLPACAADLAALARQDGPPDVVVGHSFGGKLALVWLRDHATGEPVTWALDSPPGPASAGTATTDPANVVRLLRGVPVPVADRDALRTALRTGGLPEPIVQWLLTSARRDADGWRWVWDLDGVEEMLRSYGATDLRPFLATATREVHLLRAGRSERWRDEDVATLGPDVSVHVLPDAGHWVHVDDPDGTFALLAPTFAAKAQG